jgi:uncharacterized membrane protein YjjB (DUF3815 family)
MNDALRILMLVIFTVFGVGGVALVFGVEKKHIAWGVLSAVICCVGYEVSALLGCGIFAAAFIGSALCAGYSDIMAHVLKVPATMMIILGILPLVPGASLYYTMLGAVQSDMVQFSQNGSRVLWMAAGIAIGIIAVTAISRPINARIAERIMKRIQSGHR